MIKVLVADDERWIRKGIVRMIDRELNGIGQIFEAESVTQAMEICERELPDIVLTDVCFPAENGCDLGDAVYKSNPKARIVLISAYDDFDNARRALHFRAVDYLLKPVSKEQLNKVLTQCAEQIRGEDKEKNNSSAQEQREQNMPADPSSAQIVEQICEEIRLNCSKKYTLSDMAEECHVSEAYFSGLFKKVSGKSPMSYVTSVRIEKAKELITSTEYKQRQIAAIVGYEDYQYFTKVFKKITGESPGGYKARIAREIADEENK